MGAYLDKPKTEKETEMGFMELNGYKELPFAVSSMQGWRKTMEDAHIAIPNLETQYDVPIGTSLYAVFDGHGGKEVALFCGKYFVDCLIGLESFKKKLYREALIEAFHKIDEMLVEARFHNELQEMSGNRPTGIGANFSTEEEDNDLMDDETEKENTTGVDSDDDIDPTFRLSNDSLYAEFGPDAKAETDETEDKNTAEEAQNTLPMNLGKKIASETKETLEAKLALPRAESLRYTKSKDRFKEQLEEERKREEEEEAAERAAQEATQNVPTQETAPVNDQQNADLTNTMSDAEDKGTLTKAEALNIMFKMLGFNKSGAGTASLSSETEDEDEVQPRFTQRFDLQLPTHAGTTACVALIIEGRIYVANAGDSRAVLCRDKKALAMSYDHKPEQDIEKNRIEKAGGWVTPVGRVCGNLNLSRCIGDLKYKQNSRISRAKQIITAEPDVKVVDIQSNDLFLVVACDGVWDILTNDGIVDFVSKSFVASAKNDQAGNYPLAMKNTVEQVFNHCICDDPMMDGKGGDNMTAVIVCLKPMDEVVSAFWTE